MSLECPEPQGSPGAHAGQAWGLGELARSHVTAATPRMGGGPKNQAPPGAGPCPVLPCPWHLPGPRGHVSDQTLGRAKGRGRPVQIAGAASPRCPPPPGTRGLGSRVGGVGERGAQTYRGAEAPPRPEVEWACRNLGVGRGAGLPPPPRRNRTESGSEVWGRGGEARPTSLPVPELA